MKSTGNATNGKRVEWESKCFGGRKFYRPLRTKNGLSMKSSDSQKPVARKKDLWKKLRAFDKSSIRTDNGLETGEGQTVRGLPSSGRGKETGRRTAASKNKNLNHKAANNRMEKTSSPVLYKRRFSKYTNKLRAKLSRKFKSSYKLSGKYDEPSTKYKSYVTDKDKNKAVPFKYSMCSVHGRRKSSKKHKNNSVVNKNEEKCPDLPAPGTYNHRFVYDEASRLRQQGNDVGVMYKVKTKRESTYLINGEFNRKQRQSSEEENGRQLRKTRGAGGGKTRGGKTKKWRGKVKPPEDRLLAEEDRLLAEELERRRQMDEELAKRTEKMNEIERQKEVKERRQKMETMERKARQREAAKQLRTDALNKLQEARDLKQAKRRERELSSSEEKNKQGNKETETSTRRQDENGLREIQRLQQLRQRQLEALKQNVIDDISKCDNVTGNNGEATRLRYCGCAEVPLVQDQTVLERWVLRNDGNLSAISWLRLVTRRTNCLERQVNKELRDRWLRMAIDVVVDCMVQKKRTACCSRHDMPDKNLMGKCAFRESPVCKPRQPYNCQHRTSLKMSRCQCKCIEIPGSVYYKPMKSKEGNYYQVMNMEFTATRLSKDSTIRIDKKSFCLIRSKRKYRLGIPNLYKYLIKRITHIFG